MAATRNRGRPKGRRGFGGGRGNFEAKGSAPISPPKGRVGRAPLPRARVKAARVGSRGPPLPLPRYMTSGSAGLDLLADEAVTLAPGERKLVPTGLALEIPPGYEGQVRPRSGLAMRHGIGMVNAPGTIDSDYRGELGVLLVNHGKARVELGRGERIAQLIIAPVVQAKLVLTPALSASDRGEGGFGSTGK